MPAGRVVRFDEARGYGFIVPRDGGPDVFVHANEVVSGRDLLRPGARVSYETIASDRGLRAFAVRVRPEESEADPERVDRAAYDREIAEAVAAEAATLAADRAAALRRRLVEIACGRGWLEN